MAANSSAITASMTAAVVDASRRDVRDARADGIFRWIVAAAGMLVLAALVGTALSMLWGGREAFGTFGFGFLFSTEWDAVNHKFGALVPIYGTIVTALIAMLIAVPVSFGIALFLTEVAPSWLRGPVSAAIELLAGIPSIIYGMWGLFVFAPFFAVHVEPLIVDTLGRAWLIGPLFQGAPTGLGVLTAGIILAVMVIPFIAAVMRDVFEIVPAVLKESAYAIGCTTWEVVRNIVLPYARTGVVGGIMLGLGRALGETMAVTFVIGNAYRIRASLLEPGNSIASALANEFNEAADPVHRGALIALGLVLFVLTLLVLAASRVLIARLARGEGART